MLRLIFGILVLSVLFQNEKETTKYRYVGTEKCASVCHNIEEMGFQYDIMKAGPHSLAYNVLTSETATKYAKKSKIIGPPAGSTICLKCHTTGSGLDSSFYASTYRKDDGVTCEACHKGPYITKTFLPKESDCLSCHNESVHKVPVFDFRAGCLKIAHPRTKAKL